MIKNRSKLDQYRMQYDNLLEQRIEDMNYPPENRTMTDMYFKSRTTFLNKLIDHEKEKEGICLKGEATICDECGSIFPAHITEIKANCKGRIKKARIVQGHYLTCKDHEGREKLCSQIRITVF